MAVELLVHAAFVADKIWGFMREPARICWQVPAGERDVPRQVYTVVTPTMSFATVMSVVEYLRGLR